jgi:hypothetical protein
MGWFIAPNLFCMFQFSEDVKRKSMHHGLVNLHFLDEPLQNLPLRDIVVLNIFVEFLAQRQILVLHLLVGFPTRDAPPSSPE